MLAPGFQHKPRPLQSEAGQSWKPVGAPVLIALTLSILLQAVNMAWTSHSGSVGPNPSLAIVPYPVTPLVVNLTPTSAGLDLGQNLRITSTVSGGSGSSSNWAYTWAGAPTNCTTVTGPNLSCRPNAAGHWNVTLSVHDSVTRQTTTSAVVPVAVNPDLVIVEVTNSGGKNVTVYYNFTLSVLTSGGTAPLSYSYTGLPSGCTAMSAPSLTCSPTQSGSYVVVVTVRDAAGASQSTPVPVNVTGASAVPPAKPVTIGASTYYEVAAILVVGGLIVAVLLVKARRDERGSVKRPPLRPAPYPAATTATSSPSSTAEPEKAEQTRLPPIEGAS